MRLVKTDRQGVVVGAYRDRPSAVNAMRWLQRNGIPIENVSIIDGDFHAIEQSFLFLTTGSMAKSAPRSGRGRAVCSGCSLRRQSCSCQVIPRPPGRGQSPHSA
jgi:hypothetical protein